MCVVGKEEKWSLGGLRVMGGDARPDRTPPGKPLGGYYLANHAIATTNKMFL